MPHTDMYAMDVNYNYAYSGSMGGYYSGSGYYGNYNNANYAYSGPAPYGDQVFAKDTPCFIFCMHIITPTHTRNNTTTIITKIK